MPGIQETEWMAIGLSLLMGLSAAVIALGPGVALAWLLSRRTFRGKSLLETLIFLPLVIPPVVTGYALLLLFGVHSPAGRLLEALGIRLIFTWGGMAVAATVMGFPLLVRTARHAMENVDPQLEQVARTLGCSPLRTFFTVTLPLAWPGIAAGLVLCFARALGEFGATAMISAGTTGNRTIALEIFRHYQTPGHDIEVLRLALISISLSALALIISEHLAGRSGTARYRIERGRRG
jgi:molybdate transport system permease protein